MEGNPIGFQIWLNADNIKGITISSIALLFLRPVLPESLNDWLRYFYGFVHAF
jgi:hypothetical protein